MKPVYGNVHTHDRSRDIPVGLPVTEGTAALVPVEDQMRVRRFFELYDPQRLASSDFNVLLRYIANRGMGALEDKLFAKYGANISSMEGTGSKFGYHSGAVVATGGGGGGAAKEPIQKEKGKGKDTNGNDTKLSRQTRNSRKSKVSKASKAATSAQLQAKNVASAGTVGQGVGTNANKSKKSAGFNGTANGKNGTATDTMTTNGIRELERKMESLREPSELDGLPPPPPPPSEVDVDDELGLDQLPTSTHANKPGQPTAQPPGPQPQPTNNVSVEREFGSAAVAGVSYGYGYDPTSSVHGDRHSSIRNAAGINPENGDIEASARSELFQRLTEFYKKHNLEKLHQGIGDIVEYALAKGEDRINKKLRQTYGEDLDTFEMNEQRKRKMTQTLARDEFKKEEQALLKMDPERKNLRDRLVQFFLVVDPPRAELKMDPLLNYAEKFGEMQLNTKLFDKYGQSLVTISNENDEFNNNLDKELGIKTLKQTEFSNQLGTSLNKEFPLDKVNGQVPNQKPPKPTSQPPGPKILAPLQSQAQPQPQMVAAAAQTVQPPPNLGYEAKAAGKDGKKLRRMTSRFKHLLKADTIDPELDNFSAHGGHELPEYVRLMLERYYVKYDQRMLQDGGVEAVYGWTVRNGLNKLNKKLKEKYGQSLQDFIEAANELRDDLIDFYRHADRNKLVLGIQPILDWGLRNGRNALNSKLRAKYGMDLDFDIDQEVMASASQV